MRADSFETSNHHPRRSFDFDQTFRRTTEETKYTCEKRQSTVQFLREGPHLCSRKGLFFREAKYSSMQRWTIIIFNVTAVR